MLTSRTSSLIISLLAALALAGCGDDSADTDSGVDGSVETTDSGTLDASLDASAVDAAISDELGDRTDYDALTLTSADAYASSEADVSLEAMEYSSSASDESAVAVTPGGTLTLAHTQALKTGGDTSSDDNSNFYGLNAGVLVRASSSTSSYAAGNASSLAMTDCTVSTAAEGANGVFAFGEGATATLDHVTIATTGNSSRGVDATYGGSVSISNSIISTLGDHCGALATDRYESADAPSITASNVYATTAGDGSPGIYCTGTFIVSDSTLIATGSEAAAIEGKNSITLVDTNITGNAKWGVIVYQSTSGDSSLGTGSFSATGGSITNQYAEGPLFFVCDTAAEISLSGTTLSNASDILLATSSAAAASGCGIANVNTDWGSLGGTVTFSASAQTLAGDILVCDSSSALTMTLATSSFAGAINAENVDAVVSLTLDAESTWEVTGDSYLSELVNEGTLSGTGAVFVAGTQVYP